MANVLKIKAGSGVPTTSDIVDREIAFNRSDNKLYINDSGTIVNLSGAQGGGSADEADRIVFDAQAGEALSKGDVVYISGISGNTPIVSKADADDANKMPSFGLAATSASLNNSVQIVTFGTLENFDTSAFSVGDTVFVSTTAGGLTATAPTGESGLIQNMGHIVRSHASTGAIKIVGAGRTNATPNLDDGDIFIGNASNQSSTASLNTKIQDYLNTGVNLASPTFTGDINFNDATSPSLTITDSTNTAQLRLTATDTTTDIGSLSAHKVNFRYNNDIRVQLEDSRFLVNAGSDDMNFVVKDTSGVALIHADAALSRIGIRDGSPSYTLDVNGTGRFTGAVQLDSTLTFDSVALSAIQTSSESFADNDTSLMTSAAIQDKILSYGYITQVGIDEILADDIIDSTEAFSDSDDLLMTAKAINDRIESFGYGTGTMSSWTLEGDSGSTTVTNANTVDIAGGTGITTAASLDAGRDTVTINFSAGIDDLSDVQITSVSNGQVLKYSSAESAFVNQDEDTGISFNGSTANGLLTYGNSTTADVESGLTYDGSTLAVTGDESISGVLKHSSNGSNRLTLDDDSDSAQVNQVTLASVNNVNILIDGTNNGTGDFQIRSRPTTANDLDTADIIVDIDETTAIFDNITSQQFKIGGASRTTINESGLKVESGSLGVGQTPPSVNGSAHISNLLRVGTNGEVALTVNDGGGNANVTFNHTSKVPDRDGNSGRIEVNVDSSGGEYMAFELAGNVTSGVSVATTEIARINSTGLQSSLSGTAASPALRVNDSDTGLYRIADNKLGISTAGTFAVAVDASQNVGIGTTSPSEKLEVSGKILATGGQVRSGSYLEGFPSFSFANDTDTGMFSDTANQLEFSTGGSSRLTINSSGNVGIGATTVDDGNLQIGDANSAFNIAIAGPRTKFGYDGSNAIVQGGTSKGIAFCVNNTTLGSGESMRIDSSGNVGIGTTSPSTNTLQFGSAGDTIGVDLSSGGTTRIAEIEFYNGADGSLRLKTDNASAGGIEFHTQGSQRMEVLSGGNIHINNSLGIGTSSPDAKLEVSESGTGHGLGGIISETTTHNGNAGIRFRTNGTDRWAITCIGTNGSDLRIRDADGSADRIQIDSSGDLHCDQDVIAFSTTPSDKRLKTNIQDINYGLETIMKLSPKQYDWKKDDTHDIGFIAQEVEEVIPEIVKDKKHFDKEIKTLDYEKLTAVLIKAVQEQQEQINKLEDKLNG